MSVTNSVPREGAEKYIRPCGMKRFRVFSRSEEPALAPSLPSRRALGRNNEIIGSKFYG